MNARNQLRLRPFLPAADAVIPAMESAAHAFENVQPELALIPASELVQINVDLNYAATIVLGAIPRIVPFAQSIRVLPGIPSRSIDGLAVFAHATFYTQSAWLYAGRETDEVQQLVVEVTPLRNRFVAIAELLVAFDVIEPSFVDGVRASTGFRKMAESLAALEQQLRSHWNKIENMNLISRDDLDHARVLAGKLIAAIGGRESGTLPQVRRASEARQRAFTAMANAYDDVRRGLHFVRWHEGDADEIAPSFYGRSGSSRRSGGDTTGASSSQPDAPVEPTAPDSPATPKPAIAPVNASPKDEPPTS